MTVETKIEAMLAADGIDVRVTVVTGSRLVVLIAGVGEDSNVKYLSQVALTLNCYDVRIMRSTCARYLKCLETCAANGCSDSTENMYSDMVDN